MKKILALTLTGMLALGGGGAVIASAQPAPENLPATQESVAEKGKLYLVPGTYIADGIKVENTVDGAQKLAAEECDAIFTENAYVCTLAEGAALPAPASERVDKDGNAFAFNGWWTISDATVTYFDKVPALTENTFLYADWRADLSQRKDPIIPDPGVVIEPNHYMNIKRAATGETEKIVLRKAFTNMTSAENLGYQFAVELVAEGLQLSPGDTISVYTTGLTNDEKAVITPILDANEQRDIQLEASGDGSNDTNDYLTADAGSKRRAPVITYIGEETGTFNIYIKYFSKGSTMTVYMEPPKA